MQDGGQWRGDLDAAGRERRLVAAAWRQQQEVWRGGGDGLEARAGRLARQA